MFFRILALRFLAVLLVGIGLTSTGFAGWLGFRNDTKEQLVVQETVVVNNAPRPGKPQALNSGDLVRDSQIGPGNQRKFTIYDPKGKPLYTGMFPCPAADENILYLIKTDAKGAIVIEPIKSKK
jgi:hypothetical protein